MALDIAQACDLFIQPTKGVIDDMAPAVRMFHELVQHGVPKDKLAFVLHGVLAAKEMEDGYEYATILDQAMFRRRDKNEVVKREEMLALAKNCG